MKPSHSHFSLVFLLIASSLSLTSCSSEDPNDSTCTLDIVCIEDESITENVFYIGAPTEITKKVYMHYLPWFSETATGNHWGDGVVNTPLIGYYDSKAWATHIYHILLSSLVGIDGAIINVRTDYDQKAFEAFAQSLKRIEEIYPEFDYSIGISYDDQGMTEDVARATMINLKNNVIAQTTKYLHKDSSPVIFIWNYDGYLTSQDYRDIVNEVFTQTSPTLLQNDLDLTVIANNSAIDSFYPWVKGFSEDGANWGEEYIDWFYNTSSDFLLSNKIKFITGAVWPGFDDRQASWGQDRWIDRKNGVLYNDMWNKINKNNVNIDWVILETWNDFNEGSELEPIEGDDSYQYIELTANNIAAYKNMTPNIDDEKYMFFASVQIYKAAKLIEDGNRNYDTFYPRLKSAIEKFLQKKGEESFNLAQEIINNG
jgi:hypothetical protein